MRPSSLILLAVLAAAPLAGLGDRQAAAATQAAPDRSHAGTPAPTAPFVDHAGAQHRIAEFRGKRVLVNLWATWCVPCIVEMPALDRLALRSGGKPVVIAVSQDLGGWRAIDRFFVPGKFKSVTPYLDRDNALPIALHAAGLPVTVLYDVAGKEVWRVAGKFDWDAQRPEAMAR